jgi:hypothetical protein
LGVGATCEWPKSERAAAAAAAARVLLASADGCREKSFPQPEGRCPSLYGAPLFMVRRRFSFNIRANVASHRSVLTCLTLADRSPSHAVSLATEAFRTSQHEGNPSDALVRSSSSTASSLWHAPHPAPLRTLGRSAPAATSHPAPLLTFRRTASSAGPHPPPLLTPRCFLRRSAVVSTQILLRC